MTENPSVSDADRYRVAAYGREGAAIFFALQYEAERAGAWNDRTEVRADMATTTLLQYAGLARAAAAAGEMLPEEHRQAARRLLAHWGAIDAAADCGTNAEGVDHDLAEIMALAERSADRE